MNYAIFSSPLSIAVMAAVFVLYALTALFKKLFGSKSKLPALMGALNIVMHLALIGVCLYIQASLEEILFLLIASAAIALTVTRPGKEDTDGEV